MQKPPAGERGGLGCLVTLRERSRCLPVQRHDVKGYFPINAIFSSELCRWTLISAGKHTHKKIKSDAENETHILSRRSISLSASDGDKIVSTAFAAQY